MTSLWVTPASVRPERRHEAPQSKDINALALRLRAAKGKLIYIVGGGAAVVKGAYDETGRK